MQADCDGGKRLRCESIADSGLASQSLFAVERRFAAPRRILSALRHAALASGISFASFASFAFNVWLCDTIAA